MIAWIAESDANSPWWMVAIVLPLAGFAAYLVRWIPVNHEQREKALAALDIAREAREDRRAEQDALQTQALQNVVAELRRLNEQQEEHARAIEQLRQQRVPA